MANKRRAAVKGPRISAPELPDIGPNEWPAGTAPSDGESYTDLVISGQDFNSQTASRIGLIRARLSSTMAVGAVFKFSKFTDVRFDHCDLANADLYSAVIKRVEIADCRMTGVRMNNADLMDAAIDQCKLDLAQFRQSKFKDSRFSNCNLREADFYEADLSGVAFIGCDLRGVQLYGANLDGTDFRGSQLEGLQLRAEDLKGAIISSVQMVALAREIASLLEIKVLDGDDL